MLLRQRAQHGLGIVQRLWVMDQQAPQERGSHLASRLLNFKRALRLRHTAPAGQAAGSSCRAAATPAGMRQVLAPTLAAHIALPRSGLGDCPSVAAS